MVRFYSVAGLDATAWARSTLSGSLCSGKPGNASKRRDTVPVGPMYFMYAYN